VGSCYEKAFPNPTDFVRELHLIRPVANVLHDRIRKHDIGAFRRERQFERTRADRGNLWMTLLQASQALPTDVHGNDSRFVRIDFLEEVSNSSAQVEDNVGFSRLNGRSE